jgi:heat shock protein HtpX
MVKTTLLLGLLTGVFIAVGQMLGGTGGMWIAFALAILMNGGSYWFSDRIVLKMHRATEITKESHPELVGLVQTLATRAELPMPKVYIVPDSTPNAFATGRDPEHSAVAFTQGILDRLPLNELAGVTAHELAHIKNRDILISSIAACIAGAISMLANMAQWAMIFGRRDDENDSNPIGMLVAMIVTPIAASLIQMAISRSREFVADEIGAKISGKPMDLANALQRLHTQNERAPLALPSPSMAHMYIISPLSGKSLMQLFKTHPPVEERIARLTALAETLRD